MCYTAGIVDYSYNALRQKTRQYICGPSRSASIIERREGSEKPRNNFACSSIVLGLGSLSMELLRTNAKYQQMLILYSNLLRPVFAARCSAANCLSYEPAESGC